MAGASASVGVLPRAPPPAGGVDLRGSGGRLRGSMFPAGLRVVARRRLGARGRGPRRGVGHLRGRCATPVDLAPRRRGGVRLEEARPRRPVGAVARADRGPSVGRRRDPATVPRPPTPSGRGRDRRPSTRACPPARVSRSGDRPVGLGIARAASPLPAPGPRPRRDRSGSPPAGNGLPLPPRRSADPPTSPSGHGRIYGARADGGRGRSRLGRHRRARGGTGDHWHRSRRLEHRPPSSRSGRSATGGGLAAA